MRIIFIRHGETFANIINKAGQAIYTGALNNALTDLSENGIKSAKILSLNSDVKSIERVYSSDLSRTLQTAEYAKPNHQIITDKRLRERSLGIFEGKTPQYILDSEEYKKYLYDENFKEFRNSFVQKAPQGENFTEVSQRCKDFLDSLDYTENITIGVFAHYNTIKCMFLNMFNIEPKERIFKLQIENCVPYIVEVNEKREYKLISHDLERMLKG